MIAAGSLNHLVSITTPTETAGDAQVTYNLVAKVWASRKDLGGTDRSGLVAEGATVFRIRYRADFTVKMCVEEIGRRWEIDSISDPDGARQILDLVTHEIVSLAA
jgi:SPP1 family predicted phage head-tail adaptor